jgi:hypothetical protein
VATYAVEIANGALGRLGQPAITTLADTTRDGVVCNLFYGPNRDACMAMTNWVSLTQKVALTRAGKVAITGITRATPPIVSCAGHIFAVGDLVTIEDVVGMTEVNYGMFTVQSVSGSATITLYDVEGAAIPGLGYSTYGSGGYVYRHPGNDWAFMYDLPTDCIRPICLMDENFGESDSYAWKKERTWIYANISYAALKYLKDNTDPTAWDSDLTELIESRLAWMISPRVSQDVSLRNSLYMEWQAVFARAKINNSAGQKQVQPPSALWTSAR